MNVYLVVDSAGRVVPLVFGSLGIAQEFVQGEEGGDFQPSWQARPLGLWCDSESGCSILERSVLS